MPPTTHAEWLASQGGGGASVLTDPGNVWEPNTAVTEGYRIAETVQGELRVFEAVAAGTTANDGSVFADYTIDLMPLGITSEEVDWRYLGIVGELPWTIAPRQAAFGQDGDGPYVAGTDPTSQPGTTFRILAALADPGNEWEAEAVIGAGNYRISATVDGALRVFEQGSTGTTGEEEPDWQIANIGQATTDGTTTWSYLGIVGGPDTERPVFVANSAGDADWYLDVNEGSVFRFNISDDGVLVAEAGQAEFTVDGFMVSVEEAWFQVRYDPFSISMFGLPTTDPAVPGHLWVDEAADNVLKVSAG